MKKLVVLILSYILLSTAAFAGSCPLLLKQVDEKITKSKLASEAMKEVKTLRDQGEAAHKSGKHSDSVKILEEALKKLG